MKKKLALTAAAVALVGTLAVGGTLAWFTDVETATNVVTMGEVDITLSEDGGKDGIISEDGLTYDNIVPGDAFTKTVTIKNEEEAAWVRAIVKVEGLDSLITDESQRIRFLDGEGNAIGYTVDENGNFVFNAPRKMEKGEEWTVFSKIEIPNNWDNKFVNASFNIKLVAEAIQADNNDAGFAAEGATIEDLKIAKPADDAEGTKTMEALPIAPQE